MVSIQHISKSYGKTEALKDICIEVAEGELFGLIGPDGAGKTTLFRILTTLLLSDAGTASIAGMDVVKDYRKIRDSIGYMPGKFSLYQDMTVEENLAFYATIFHTTIEQNYHLVKDVYEQIEPFRKRRAGKLSGGMKQKLALCCALIHQPIILFLDEPTTGVDPVSRKELWEMLKNLKAKGITIIVSTPYMDEASLCDRIALMQQGEMLSVDTPANMTASYPKKLYTVETKNNRNLLKELRKNPAVCSVYSFGQTLHITFNDLPDNNIHGLKETKPTIEDCFIQLRIENFLTEGN